jgi:hypothetical protein
MNNSISNRTLIKYVIIIGLIYAILRMVPAETLANKDMLLIIAVIIIGFVCLECLFKDKSEEDEDFANLPTMRAPGKAILPTKAVMTAMPPTPTKRQVATMPPTPTKRQVATMPPTVEMEQVAATMPPTPTKKQVATIMPTAIPIQKVVTVQQPMQQPMPPMQQPMPPMQQPMQYNPELELMKQQINALKNQLDSTKQPTRAQVNNDFKYNEMPVDMYVPIGNKIANNWSTDNEYAILNTNQWQVPIPRPPVCINTEPCKVCPSDGTSYLTLKNWDNARVVSETKINQQWAADQR